MGKEENGSKAAPKPSKLGAVGDLLAGGSFVEIRGRYRVKLNGVGRILCYSDTRLVFALGRETVTVAGERLECVSFGYGMAIVAGCISGVYYGRGEADL